MTSHAGFTRQCMLDAVYEITMAIAQKLGDDTLNSLIYTHEESWWHCDWNRWMVVADRVDELTGKFLGAAIRRMVELQGIDRNHFWGGSLETVMLDFCEESARAMLEFRDINPHKCQAVLKTILNVPVA